MKLSLKRSLDISDRCDVTSGGSKVLEENVSGMSDSNFGLLHSSCDIACRATFVFPRYQQQNRCFNSVWYGCHSSTYRKNLPLKNVSLNAYKMVKIRIFSIWHSVRQWKSRSCSWLWKSNINSGKVKEMLKSVITSTSHTKLKLKVITTNLYALPPCVLRLP